MTHATTRSRTPVGSGPSPNAPSIASRGRCRRRRDGSSRRSGLAPSETDWGAEAVGRHKGSRAPTPRADKPCGEDRAARAPLAYRGANGPSLLTKQAHSTCQYPQCSQDRGGRGSGWGRVYGESRSVVRWWCGQAGQDSQWEYNPILKFI